MHTAVDWAFPPGHPVARCQQDYAGEGDEFTTMHSAHTTSITGMKLAIISKAAAIWNFSVVGFGVGSRLRAVQLAAAALRPKAAPRIILKYGFVALRCHNRFRKASPIAARRKADLRSAPLVQW